MATIVRDGTLPAYAWPGGYPLYYLCADGGTLCPACANKENVHTHHAGMCRCPENDAQWCIVFQEVHWEGQPLICDHCGVAIPSAYGED